jgi:maltooligosyltrehalose trehalohydrolase
MLFMGQEFGASSPFQFFTDHNPELGKLVTQGRRREFEAFSAFADPATRERIPDPQAESTFLRSKLPLGEIDGLLGSTLYAWYTALLRLRRTDPVLIDQSRERMEARALTTDVLAVRRWSGPGERLLLANFGAIPLVTDHFGDGWRVVLDFSESARVDGKRLESPPANAVVLAR